MGLGDRCLGNTLCFLASLSANGRRVTIVQSRESISLLPTVEYQSSRDVIHETARGLSTSGFEVAGVERLQTQSEKSTKRWSTELLPVQLQKCDRTQFPGEPLARIRQES